VTERKCPGDDSQSVGDPGSVHEGQWGARALFMRVSGDPGSVHEGQWGAQALFMRVSGGPRLCS